MADWSAAQYLKFEDERTRPARDLVAQVPVDFPRRVVDIGCGPGNLTALLEKRWPSAHVAGIDSSEEMIERAKADHPGLDFAVEAVGEYLAGRPIPVDVIISNATLQWVPGHLDLLPGLVAAVRPGGWLALQVPGNFDQPSHTLCHELAATPPYDEHTQGVDRPAFLPNREICRSAKTAVSAVLAKWPTTSATPACVNEAASILALNDWRPRQPMAMKAAALTAASRSRQTSVRRSWKR